jgi:hypothetical protein
VGMYYDREGNELSLEQWAVYHEVQNKRVAETDVEDFWVSTVWLGLDHSYGDGPPLIFETMVFPKDGPMLERYCERYPSEDAARAGHDRAVAWTRDHLEALQSGMNEWDSPPSPDDQEAS